MNILYVDTSGTQVSSTFGRWEPDTVIWPATSFEEAYRVATEHPTMQCVVIGSNERSSDFERFMCWIASHPSMAIISATGDPRLDCQLLTKGCRVAMPVQDVPSYVRQLTVD